MSDPSDDRPLQRSRRRDADLRTVSRAGRAVAAVGVSGTVIFGGLAAVNTYDSSASASAGASASAEPSTAAEGDAVSNLRDAVYGEVTDWLTERIPYVDELTSPPSAPAASQQEPAASSGGS